MAARDIVVIGTSAGGIDALRRIAAALPPDLHSSIFIVQHLSASSPGYLPGILAASSRLPVVSPLEPLAIQRGVIHVARPDMHLVIEDGHVASRKGPRENLMRPSIDVLFRSAATAYGPRVVGCVLTGTLGDGAAGLWAVRRAGGIAIVQDPADAQHPEMPLNALRLVNVHYRLPLHEIPRLITMLAEEPAPPKPPGDQPVAALPANSEPVLEDSAPANLACPSCRGVLAQSNHGRLVEYRCHVGHTFTPAALAAAQEQEIERLLYGALSLMEERADLLRRVSARYFRGKPADQERYQARIVAMEHRASQLREMIESLDTMGEVPSLSVPETPVPETGSGAAGPPPGRAS